MNCGEQDARGAVCIAERLRRLLERERQVGGVAVAELRELRGQERLPAAVDVEAALAPAWRASWIRRKRSSKYSPAVDEGRQRVAARVAGERLRRVRQRGREPTLEVSERDVSQVRRDLDLVRGLVPVLETGDLDVARPG